MKRKDDVMKGVVLPEGYRLLQVETLYYYCVERTGPGGGGCTIDVKHRRVRAGYNTTYGEHYAGETPTGRGWQQKLVDVAVRALKDIWETKPDVWTKARHRG